MNYTLRLYQKEGRKLKDITDRIVEPGYGITVEGVDHIPQIGFKVKITPRISRDSSFAGIYSVFNVVEEIKKRNETPRTFEGQHTLVEAVRI